MAKASPTPTPQRRAASFMPDDLVPSGRPSGFWARVKEYVFIPFNYEKKERDSDEATKIYKLCYRLTLAVDEGQHVTGEVVERGFSGWLNSFVPSEDGNEPVMPVEKFIALSKGEDRLDGDEVEDYKGHFALPLEQDLASKRARMLEQTVHSQLTTAFLNTGFVPEDGADLASFEGFHGYWELDNEIKKPGSKSDKENKVLVPTEWDEKTAVGNKVGTAKATGAKLAVTAKTNTKPAPASADDTDDTDDSTTGELSEFDQRVVDTIKSIISAAGGTILRRTMIGKLGTVFSGKDLKHLNPAVALVKSAGAPLLENQNGIDWVYDAEGDTLIGLE